MLVDNNLVVTALPQFQTIDQHETRSYELNSLGISTRHGSDKTWLHAVSWPSVPTVSRKLNGNMPPIKMINRWTTHTPACAGTHTHTKTKQISINIIQHQYQKQKPYQYHYEHQCQSLCRYLYLHLCFYHLIFSIIIPIFTLCLIHVLPCITCVPVWIFVWKNLHIWSVWITYALVVGLVGGGVCLRNLKHVFCAFHVRDFCQTKFLALGQNHAGYRKQNN